MQLDSVEDVLERDGLCGEASQTRAGDEPCERACRTFIFSRLRCTKCGGRPKMTSSKEALAYEPRASVDRLDGNLRETHNGSESVHRCDLRVGEGRLGRVDVGFRDLDL